MHHKIILDIYILIPILISLDLSKCEFVNPNTDIIIEIVILIFNIIILNKAWDSAIKISLYSAYIISTLYVLCYYIIYNII